MPDFTDWLRPRVRSMQIVALALPAGALMTTTVLFYLRFVNPQPGPAQPMISFLAAGSIAIMCVLSFLLPRLIHNAQLKQMAAGGVAATPEQLVGLCQTTLIVGLALLEGAVFFSAIAYFIEGQWWVLPGILVGVSLMALRLPTEMSVLAWLDDAGQALDRLRLAK